MKLTGYGLGVASLLAPAIASAQDPQAPSAPQAPPAPQAPQAPQTPQTPQTPQAPPPAAAPNTTSSQQPVVVVNPNQPGATNTEAVPVAEEAQPLNPPVFLTGALVFAGTYGASVIVAGDSNEHGGHHHLYVPIAGPWLDLADRPSCDPTENRCDHETTTKVLLVADGVFQAAGILTMLDGVLDPGRRHVSHSYADNKKVHVLPTTFAGTGGGVNVFGHF
jgi:hypothetical protein